MELSVPGTVHSPWWPHTSTPELHPHTLNVNFSDANLEKSLKNHPQKARLGAVAPRCQGGSDLDTTSHPLSVPQFPHVGGAGKRRPCPSLAGGREGRRGGPPGWGPSIGQLGPKSRRWAGRPWWFLPKEGKVPLAPEVAELPEKARDRAEPPTLTP